MENLEPSRPTRNTAKGKLRKKTGEPSRAPEAYLAEIQKTGWTPEIEANLLATPTQLHIQPELMDGLIADAAQRGDAKLWRLLACVCEGKGEERYAVTCATEALRLQPTDVTAMGVLARLCEKRHIEQEAADWHRRIVVVDPTQVDSLRFLAQVHYQRGEYEPALQYWNQLLEAEPKIRTNKLYWLLSTVKSAGIHGLAQPLTDVRRWRTLTQEETPLAHELFLLVAKLCLQTRQRARAKQYLTRALQLSPTPEVEALLAEIADQSPVTATKTSDMTATVPPALVPSVKAQVAIPHPSGPIRLKYPVVPHPPVVRPEGAWSGRPRMAALLSSGVGVITLMCIFAVVVMWSLSDDPSPSALVSTRENRVMPLDASVVSSVPAKEIPSLNAEPIRPQTPPVVVPPAPPSVSTSIPVVAPTQSETKKIEATTPARENLTQPPAPVAIPKPDVQPRPAVTQPVASKPTTDPVVQAQVPAPPPATKQPTQNIPPVNRAKPDVPSRSVVTQPVPPKPTIDTVVQTQVPALPPPPKEPTQNTPPVSMAKLDVQPRPPVTQPVPSKPTAESGKPNRELASPTLPLPNPPVQPAVAKPLSPPQVPAAKEIVSPENLNVHSSPSFYAPTNREDAPLSPSPSVATPENPPPPASMLAAVERETPRSLPQTEPPPTKAPLTPEKKTEMSLTEEVTALLREPKPTETRESQATEKTTATDREAAESPAVAASAESQEPASSPPTREGNEHNVLAAVVDASAPPAAPSAENRQRPEATKPQTEEGERTTAVESNNTTPQTDEVAIRSVRSPTRFSQESRFPVRERLVAVPPEKLLLEMPELMRQEIDNSTVRKISRGVIRARVSGRPRNPTRPPKEYGQYLVEIVPGPTEGTSRVRTQALLFNWRTGDPIGDADDRADSLLKKIPDE